MQKSQLPESVPELVGIYLAKENHREYIEGITKEIIIQRIAQCKSQKPPVPFFLPFRKSIPSDVFVFTFRNKSTSHMGRVTAIAMKSFAGSVEKGFEKPVKVSECHVEIQPESMGNLCFPYEDLYGGEEHKDELWYGEGVVSFMLRLESEERTDALFVEDFVWIDFRK